MAWSSDYGDFWSAIEPSYIVQDFTFDTGKAIYTLSPQGIVQRLVYSGTAWSNTIPVTNCGLYGHTIVARNGQVLVARRSPTSDRGDSLFRQQRPELVHLP